MYNYLENEIEDVKNYIVENLEELKGHDKEELDSILNDDLFADDGVTGNASGSYTFSTYQAEENLVGNWDLLQEALEEFGENEINPIEKGAEWCDVTIRCYLLWQAIAEALEDEEIQKKLEL